MRRYFDENGSEYTPKLSNDRAVILTAGGVLKETNLTLSVYSKQLDKEKVSNLLGLTPTKAWNPFERHPYGGPHNKKTRILDWGKWYYSTETNVESLDAKIEKLFALCTPNLEIWQRLSEEYQTWLTIVGHLDNWNREANLSRKTLKWIADRSLDLTFDIYFDAEDDED